ncbi:DUF3093 domain-containing protein [Cellulomonas sp. APG4]|uniref:DUF3093 domain-containing protein n=1 Tax=Cellulomonas sp. APG4 TaxID=1538656 RepID=UPI00351BD7B6
MSTTSPSPRTTSPLHRERLWPGPLGWSLVLGFAVLVTISLHPVRPAVAYVVGAASLAAGAAVAVRTAAVVEVRDGELRAGPAHIPVALLGPARVLDKDGVRAALGPGSDARTFAVLRAWVPGAVHVEVADQADPTPAWLVSSRRPEALRSALEAARD